MVLLVAGGVAGKCIFALIPRSLSGMELNRIELVAGEIGLTVERRNCFLPPILSGSASPPWRNYPDACAGEKNRSLFRRLPIYEPSRQLFFYVQVDLFALILNLSLPQVHGKRFPGLVFS